MMTTAGKIYAVVENLLQERASETYYFGWLFFKHAIANRTTSTADASIFKQN